MIHMRCRALPMTPPPQLLLITHLALLFPQIATINMCLPRRRPNILDRARRAVEEYSLHFLERLPCRLGEEEEDVDEHADAEDAEEDVHSPFDVGECGRDEVGECEVAVWLLVGGS